MWVGREVYLSSYLHLKLIRPCCQKQPLNVIQITNIQQIMFGGYFEGFIMNRYGSYGVFGSDFKNIHHNLIDVCGFRTITLTIGWNFVTTFPLRLNVGSLFYIQNFRITFKNKFEHKDWGFVLRVGTSTIIDQIDPFLITLQLVPTHSIHEFMERLELRIGHNRGCGHWYLL